MEIYNQQYWWRLIATFADDFPGVRAVVGPKAFDQLTIAYLEACPSRSWSLRNLGAKFAEFLAEHPDTAAKLHAPLARDVAAVEWAATAAFDDPERERLDPKKLAAADPSTLRLDLQPYLQLLELRHPVDRLLAKLRKRTDDSSAASNAVGHRKARRAPRIASRPLREPLYLAVHRVDFSVGEVRAKVVSVVAFVGDQTDQREPFDQGLRLCGFMHLSGGEDHPQRMSERINRDVNFGAQAAARAPNVLIMNPPFAPAAC